MRLKAIATATIASAALLGASTGTAAAAPHRDLCSYANGRTVVCPPSPVPPRSHKPFTLRSARRTVSRYEHQYWAGDHLRIRIFDCRWSMVHHRAACTVDLPSVVLVTNTLPVHIEWTDIVRRGWRLLTVRSLHLRQIH